MLIVRHRINTSDELKKVPASMGIELDIRSEGSRLILQHDPFKPGEDFETFLKDYRHAFMILNVKAEGLEDPALELMRQFKITNYFFLDLSFPAAWRLMCRGESKIAVRFSELEPLEQCLSLAGKADWVWVDCFTRYPLDKASYAALKKTFKLCLVSPELEQHPVEKIPDFQKTIAAYPANAVCTKYPERWTS